MSPAERRHIFRAIRPTQNISPFPPLYAGWWSLALKEERCSGGNNTEAVFYLSYF